MHGLDFNIEVTGFEMGEIDLRIASLDQPSERDDDPADALPTARRHLPEAARGWPHRVSPTTACSCAEPLPTRSPTTTSPMAMPTASRSVPRVSSSVTAASSSSSAGTARATTPEGEHYKSRSSSRAIVKTCH